MLVYLIYLLNGVFFTSFSIYLPVEAPVNSKTNMFYRKLVIKKRLKYYLSLCALGEKKYPKTTF